MSAANLRLVNEDGEIVEGGCPECSHNSDVIAGLERDIRGWASRYAMLKRDRDMDARNHESWAEVKRLFDEWRKECKHPRSKFTVDDFLLAEPFFRDHGADLVRRAISGAAFDAFVTTRKNGSAKRHDDWELIFRSRAKFEEFANRAPVQA